MNWKDIAKTIASDAPLLSGVLAATGVGAPLAAVVSVAGSLVSAALGVPNTPDDVALALKTDPEAAVKLRAIEATHGEEMAKIAAAREAAQLNAQAVQVTTVNETMRVEDTTRKFSWRDFWGYVSGAGFGFVVVVIGYLVVGAVWHHQPELMAPIPAIVGSFTLLFGIAAGVLGVQSGIETHHAGVVDRINAGETRSVATGNGAAS